MQIKKIKQTLIDRYQRYILIRAFLSMILYLHNDTRKTNISFFKVIYTFLFHFIYLVYNEVKFFLYKILNTIREIGFAQKLRKQILLNIPLLKKNTFIIPYPVNLKKKDNRLFKNSNFYYIRPSKLIKVKKAYLYIATEFGIVYKNFIINSKSIHGKWDRRNVKIIKSYYDMIFTRHVESEFSKKGEIIFLDSNNNYLLIHNWFNYYHWITESLYRLLSVSGSLEKYTLLLPESLQSNNFVNDSLKAIPNINIKYIQNNSIIKFPKLNFVTQKKYCDNYEASILKKIKDYYFEYIINNNIKSPLDNDKIFISRKASKRRFIQNENEFYDVLKTHGFAIVDFEDYSFFEQVAMMQQTKYLIGIHGSGMTNMIFMKEGGKILDFYRHIKSSKDHHCIVYWRLAGVLKHEFYYQFCEPITSNNVEKYANRKNYFNADFHTFHLNIDITEFENNLILLLAE